MNYERKQGETDDEVIYRICADKDIIGTWDDVKDILNEVLGNDFGEQTYRKKWNAFNRMLDAHREIVGEADEVSIINDKIRKLEREKIKYRDQRNAWNKQNYADGRAEENYDLLVQKLTEIGRLEFPPVVEHTDIKSDNDVLVVLSDFHIGQDFETIGGKYNSDIAKERLGQLANEVIQIKERHGSENCYISLQGDLLSGNIHKTVQITNRENVIDQVKVATELIASFCYKMAQYFDNVYMVSCAGNHSRLEKKEDALHDERLDSLVAWAVELSLSSVKNFKYLSRDSLDSGIAMLTIRDKMYLCVHGDFDAYNKTGLSDLVLYIGQMPYAVVYGHLHTPALDEHAGIKMIRGGSLCGTGDQYTLEKRLYSKPSQMVCVCNNQGVLCYYPVELE